MKSVTWIAASLGLVVFSLFLIFFPTRMVAFGTVLVAVVAIWGEWIRSAVAGPKMQITLKDAKGWAARGSPYRRYTLMVYNKRHWASAKNVRVLCEKMFRRSSDGCFEELPLYDPIQLRWTRSSVRKMTSPRLNPDISSMDMCALGAMSIGGFALDAYCGDVHFPHSDPSRGHSLAGETVRIELIVVADNFRSKAPYVLEIAWDGERSEDAEEMSKHLVIKELRQLNFKCDHT
ncbi:MAG: hypothetical protein Q8Q12_02690 [bacterium]|nr:hypothetical protein [bacterium]